MMSSPRECKYCGRPVKEGKNCTCHESFYMRKNAELQQQLEQAQAKAENCEREARQWRQEARTQSAIVAEIYQELTGRTGEPGNWNGARPLKPAILRKQAEAVECFAEWCSDRWCATTLVGVKTDAEEYAQRLRQQADEAEKGTKK